jgi:hypothetical protein
MGSWELAESLQIARAPPQRLAEERGGGSPVAGLSSWLASGSYGYMYCLA